jgi:hypothetical protein
MDKDEAKNDTERLTNGTATLQEILAEWGIDWKAAIRQRGRELKFMEAEGVPPPGAQQAPPAPPTEPETEEEPEPEEDDDEEQDKAAASHRLNGHFAHNGSSGRN